MSPGVFAPLGAAREDEDTLVQDAHSDFLGDDNGDQGRHAQLPDTPRSILSTPRALLAGRRQKRDELFAMFFGSVSYLELSQLTRRQLRQRLQDLEAARSEGDGMTFGHLVHNVLLWNVMDRVHSDTAWSQYQEDAIEAVKKNKLPLDLAQRALLIMRAVDEPGFDQYESVFNLKQPAAQNQLVQLLEKRRPQGVLTVGGASNSPEASCA